ncbi:MAG TPA: ABC transporter permease [Candidatus Ornithocaccomicrobium faecavium]|uniref:ABC transporter permease n=1 Tax=Candidatus Ornithocaccomicrobium faecavium TaxID=2840890 RepID=A0A9D1P9W3_9FIRM|nr:ABC transporter permease [Candidatus Ornithocaccomicrobium faecavium]
MVKYVCKRVLLLLMVFFVIISICFVLIKLLPNKPAEQFGKDMALIEMRREALGYNKPLIEQYWIFIQKSLIGGDWGISETLYLGQNVWDKFMEKMPATMLVNSYAMLFSVPLGLLFGIYAALRKNKWQDHFISTAVMIFVSVPSYVYAFLVQYLLCFKLKWFPFQMAAGFDYFSWETFHSLIPAILSLGFGTIAGLTRYTRAELTEVLTSDYLLLARTKGLSRAQTTVRHALRNSMVPIFPMILGEFIGIIGGSLIIEQIFGIPGVGALYIDSITAATPDYNFFMLLSAFYTLVGLVSGILVDLSYGFIDPRIRMGSKK